MEVWETSVSSVLSSPSLPSSPPPSLPLSPFSSSSSSLFSPPVSSLPSVLSDSVLLCSSSIHYVIQACAPTSSVIVCYLGSLFPALPGRGYAALALVLCLLGRSTAHRSSSLGCAQRNFYLVPESLFSSQGSALPPPIPPGSASGQLLETCCHNKQASQSHRLGT